MLDQSLESKLRAALRAEGDDLSFTITAQELERRLALRRRGGPGPLASLGLAAAVGVGLLGLAAVVGGWFEPRPAIVPPPSPSIVAQASPSPSSNAEASPHVSTLPTLDDLLAGLDPARVVRAEAVGPSGGLGDQLGPDNTPIGPNTVTLDPVAASAAYDVLTVCAGDAGITLRTVRADPAEAVEEVPITCDGTRSRRQMGLAAGDALQVTSSRGIGWRVVLLAPDRPAPHATAIDRGVVVPDGADVAFGAESPTLEPDYADLQTGGGIRTRTVIGSVTTRTRYDVFISCAGPTSVRYTFGGVRSSEEPVAPGLAIDYVAGEVECDGTLQHDMIELTLGGAEVSVTAEDRTAWRIVVTVAKPPIALAPDEGGWKLATGAGPNFDMDGQPEITTMPGADGGGDIRLVVTCAGPTTLDLLVDTGPVVGQRVDHLTVDCRPGSGTVAKVYRNAAPYLQVTSDPHRVPTWIAISVQVR